MSNSTQFNSHRVEGGRADAPSVSDDSSAAQVPRLDFLRESNAVSGANGKDWTSRTRKQRFGPALFKGYQRYQLDRRTEPSNDRNSLSQSTSVERIG